VLITIPTMSRWGCSPVIPALRRQILWSRPVWTT
jgi:hypothetical protein